MPHVFISYVREDSAVVDRLATALRRRRVPVWLDRSDIAPGERWQDAIRRAIREGDFFLACFSAASLEKSRSYMNEELTIAIEELRLRPSERSWFLPVMLSDCDLPDLNIGAGATLRAIQHVPLYRDWSKGMAALLSAVKTVVPKARHERALQGAAEVRIVQLIEKLFEPEEDDNPYQPKMHATAEEIAAVGIAAVPFLVKRLKECKFPSRILLCLGTIGETAREAAPAVLEFWQQLSKTKRNSYHRDVFWALGKLKNPSATPMLLKELSASESPHQYYREELVSALGEIGGESAVPALIQELSRWNPPFRRSNDLLYKPFPFSIAKALISIGRPAAANLEQILSSSDHRFRVSVTYILSRIDEARTPTYEKALASAVRSLDSSAVEALCAFRLSERVPKRLVDDIILASRAADPHIRFLATGLLYGWCERDDRVAVALREREADEEYVVASAARGGIRG
jgi:HEAT repeat protein